VSHDAEALTPVTERFDPASDRRHAHDRPGALARLHRAGMEDAASGEREHECADRALEEREEKVRPEAQSGCFV
jgi:hypothetical protein